MDDTFVILHTFENAEEADAARAYLSGAGVEAVVDGGHVKVPKSDLELARGLTAWAEMREEWRMDEAPQETADEPIATVAKFHDVEDPTAAESVREQLDAEEIEAWVMEERVPSWVPHLGAVNSIRVEVRQSDENRALALLYPDEDFSENADAEEEEPTKAGDVVRTSTDPVACPQCGATEVKVTSPARSWLGMLVIIVTVAIVIAVIIGALAPVVLVVPAILVPGILKTGRTKCACWRCDHRWEQTD